MWAAAAVLALLATFLVVLAAVRRVRRRPLGLDVALALAATLSVEAAILNALSLLHAVSRGGVLAAHLLVVAAAAAWLRGLELRRTVRRAVRAVGGLGWGGALLLPVAVLAALSAWRYAPNNWDSMSYHLARVAHWIQHRSVASYDTNIARQVALLPGAEYLVLALQVMSGSERLASLVQLGAWIAVVLAAPALARLAGAPRRIALAAAPIVGAAPMLVLQASSTQNDLVAAVTAVAGIAALLPFLHRPAGRWRLADAGLLGLVLAAGGVVKLSAPLAVLPLALAGVLLSLRRVSTGAEPARRAAAGLAVLLLVASAVVVPEVVRRAGDARLSPYVARFTYPVLGELADRALNVPRSVLRHVPAPHAVVAAFGIPDRCVQNGWLSSDALARNHEEYAGNTLLVLVALAGVGLGALRWRSLPQRGRLFLVTTVAGWVLFQVTFRDNEWISRLEVPALTLSAVLLASLGGLAPRGARLARPALAALAVLAAASGARTAAGNDLRPPLRDFPRDVGGAESYYAERPQLRWMHEAVLASARATGCRRLGLVLDEDSWDYPLTWPAVQSGIEVRHLLGPDPWPCLVFVDPMAQAVPGGLVPTGLHFLFLNGGEPRTGSAHR